jgi:hypothetical protein
MVNYPALSLGLRGSADWALPSLILKHLISFSLADPILIDKILVVNLGSILRI